MQEQQQRQAVKKKPRPITVKIEDFKNTLNDVIAESELPPFILEMLIGEYLAGVSHVAQREYAQDREEWEKAGEADGGHKQGD